MRAVVAPCADIAPPVYPRFPRPDPLPRPPDRAGGVHPDETTPNDANHVFRRPRASVDDRRPLRARSRGPVCDDDPAWNVEPRSMGRLIDGGSIDG